MKCNCFAFGDNSVASVIANLFDIAADTTDNGLLAVDFGDGVVEHLSYEEAVEKAEPGAIDLLLELDGERCEADYRHAVAIRWCDWEEGFEAVIFFDCQERRIWSEPKQEPRWFDAKDWRSEQLFRRLVPAQVLS